MPLGLGHLRCSADRAAVEVHQAAVWRRMRKDHAAAAPVARCVRPGPRRRVAHPELLCLRQRHAALAQVRLAAAPRQGGLERGQVLCEVGQRWGGRTRRRARRRRTAGAAGRPDGAGRALGDGQQALLMGQRGRLQRAEAEASAQGGLPARAGSPLAGRVSHSLDDKQSFMETLQPPIPCDPQGLVALNFLYSGAARGGNVKRPGHSPCP
jgi:hypothetical protein